MKKTIFASILFCLSMSSAAAQNDRDAVLRAGNIPAGLRPLLVERIERFVEAQRRGEGERVSDFLAGNQKNPPGRPYSNEQKQCIGELLKTGPLTGFTMTKISFSTRNLSVPLNQRIWLVSGDAEFQDGPSKRTVDFTARYFNRNWYFSLPEFYENEWREKKSAKAEPPEAKDLLTVIEQPGSPVEFFDVSVKIDPANPGRRIYGFRVRNKTKKKIVAYEYRLEEFPVAGAARNIDAGADAADGGAFDANRYFCEEKERPVRMRITEVRFGDGTRWKSRLTSVEKAKPLD